MTWQEYPNLAFGNVILTSGNKLTTPVDIDMWGGGAVLIEDYAPFEQIFGEYYDTIVKGTQVSITIIYDKHAIFEKVVTVE